LCEVGEGVLFELFAHQWIKFQTELDVIAPFYDALDQDNRGRFDILAQMMTVQTAYYPGSQGIAPAFRGPE